ncbi:MAG: glycosyltransferase [Gemmatimonadota bacterium]
MKILFAVHGYKPAYRVGGPIVSVSAVAEGMVRRGHEVTVFTSNANLDEELDVPTERPVDVEGVQVWYFRRREYLQTLLPFVPYLSKSMGFLYAPLMRAELDRLVPQVDLVHTHMPYVYPSLAAGRAALRHRKPLFYHQRGVFDPERLKFRGLKKRIFIAALERPLMQRAATLIALTEAERESYRALGVETPCRIIPNGIDVGEYRTAPLADMNARWGLPADAFVILFLSRVHPTKGADKLLDAFTRLSDIHPHAYLVLAGPDEFGLEASFRERARAGGLAHRIIFPGMVQGDEKRDLLARADLFCLPSDAEGFSMAVLEALASGTGAVLSPGCHFPGVETEGAGRVVAAEPIALAAVLGQLISAPETVREMGIRARQLVARDYTWGRITDALIETYHEGIARAQSVRGGSGVA